MFKITYDTKYTEFVLKFFFYTSEVVFFTLLYFK